MITLLEIGYKHHDKQNSKNKIQLVNLITVSYILSLLIIISLGILVDERLVSNKSLMAYAIFSIVLSSIFLFQSKGLFSFAQWFLITVSFVNGFIFDKYILPGFDIKYYHIIPTLLSLFLLNKTWMSHLLVGVSILLFFDFFGVHNGFEFDSKSIHITNYFVVIYMMVFITVRSNKKQEQALEEKNAELKEIQEYKNRFFVQVAHEIKTPVTIFSGNAKLLFDGIKNPNPNQIEEYKEIKRQQRNLLRITDDVLDLERMQEFPFALNKITLDLVELVKKSVASFQSNFEEKYLEFKVSIHLTSALIDGSRVHLERMLNNILSNAIKFSPEKSTIHVVLKELNGCYSLRISDEGIGIPKEDLERVFEHFYQSQNHITASTGTGVGLAFCKEVVNLHDGVIKIDPNIEKGITVCISLPIDPTLTLEEESVDENRQGEEVSQKTQTKILLVDDNKEIRIYLRKVLKDYVITEAENGKEALLALEKTPFDLVITDYMMPEMNGLELLKEIKNRKYEAGVIILTARTTRESRLSALRLGVDDYLHKPFEQEELLLRIKHLINNQGNREEEIENPVRNAFLDQVQLVVGNVKTLENFKITDLAELLNVSPSTLLRNIKSYTGLTAKQYLKEIGLQRARRMFEVNKHTNIKTLMNEAGMKNQTYFSREFMERFGIDLKRK